MIAALIGELQVAEIALILLGIAAFIAVCLYVSGDALRRAPSDVERAHARLDAIESALVEDRARREVAQ